jgi:hypothetical protein
MEGLLIRKEVQAFCDSSENLLSLALLASTLTPEECMLIADYVLNLADSESPWGKYFLTSVRYSIRPTS